MCECWDKDVFGNYLYEACCYHNGICESDATNVNETIGSCIHCGGEMFKENGFWWHHSQKDIPLKERGTVHIGI
jgi:hypothetical protein